MHLRERRGGAQRDRRQEREHLSLDPLRDRPELARRAVLERADADARGGECRSELLLPQRVLLGLEPDDRFTDLRERLRRRAPVRSLARDTGACLLPELGHAHREELVEVRRDDRAELDPVEQRQARVGREAEDAPIEVEPGQLAVEELPSSRPWRRPRPQRRDVRPSFLGPGHCVDGHDQDLTGANPLCFIPRG